MKKCDNHHCFSDFFPTRGNLDARNLTTLIFWYVNENSWASICQQNYNILRISLSLVLLLNLEPGFHYNQILHVQPRIDINHGVILGEINRCLNGFYFLIFSNLQSSSHNFLDLILHSLGHDLCLSSMHASSDNVNVLGFCHRLMGSLS